MSEEDEISEWFQADAIEKLSEKQISFHRRILEAKGQLLCYYSAIPSRFAEKKEVPPGVYPKQGIQFANLKAIEGDDQSTRKQHRPNVFLISFNKRHLIDFRSCPKDALGMRERLRNSYIPDIDLVGWRMHSLEKDINDIQWVFQCKNQKERDSWIERLKVLKEYFKEKLVMQMNGGTKPQKINKAVSGANLNTNNQNIDKFKQKLDRIDEEEFKNNNASFNSNIQNVRKKFSLSESQEEDEDEVGDDSNANYMTEMMNINSNQDKRGNMRQQSMIGGDDALVNSGVMSEHPDFQIKMKSKMFSKEGELDATIINNIQKKAILQKQEEEKEKLRLQQEKERKDREEQEQEKIKIKFKQEEENRMRNKLVYDSVYELRYSDLISGQDQTVLQLQRQQRFQQQIIQFQLLSQNQLEKDQSQQSISPLQQSQQLASSPSQNQLPLPQQQSQQQLLLPKSISILHKPQLSTSQISNQSQTPQNSVLHQSPNSVSFSLFPPSLVTQQSVPLYLQAQQGQSYQQQQFYSMQSSSGNQEENKKILGQTFEKFKNDWSVLELIGQFNLDAQEATKDLIEDFLLPHNQKKYFPIRFQNSPKIDSLQDLTPENIQAQNNSNGNISYLMTSPQQNFEMSPNFEFRVQFKSLNNFIIKLAWVAIEEVQLNDFESQKNSSKKDNNPPNEGEILEEESIGIILEKLINSNHHIHKQVIHGTAHNLTFEAYTNYYGKALSSEFKAINLINTEHIKHKNEWQYWIKVPLSCVVSYKGFKALVQANPPDEGGLVHGPHFNKDKYYEGYRDFPELEPQLEQIGKSLGIKPHFFQNGNNPKCKIFLSFITEVYKGQRFHKVQQMIKDEPEIQDRLVFKQETYYLKNIGDIFPVNENYKENQPIISPKTVQFRQEFLSRIGKQLNPDAFEDEDQESQQDAEEIVSTSLYLETTYLPQFLKQIDDLSLDVIDSFSLQQGMHQAGINIKYLGYLASHTTIPFIQTLIHVDMVARAFKKVLSSTISNFYLQSSKWINSETPNHITPNLSTSQLSMNRQGTFGTVKSNSLVQLSINNSPILTSQVKNRNELMSFQINYFHQLKESRVKQADDLGRDAIIDILNLLFGNDIESFQFHNILIKQIQYDFAYTPNINIAELSKGQLLSAVSFHSSLTLAYTIDLFTTYFKNLIEVQNYLSERAMKRNNQKKPADMKSFESSSAQPIFGLFSKEMLIEQSASSSVFTMDALQIMQFIKNNAIDLYGNDSYGYDEDGDDDGEIEDKNSPQRLNLRIQALNMKLDILKQTKTMQIDLHLFLLYKIARIYFKKRDYQNAAKYASESIQISTIKLEEEEEQAFLIPRGYLVRCLILLVEMNLKYCVPNEYKSQAAIAQQSVMKLIKFLVNENHPLFFELTKVFITDKIKRSEQQSASLKKVIENEIAGLIKALGKSHILTGERYKVLAEYIIQFDKTSSNDSLLYLEKALTIFKDFTQNKLNQNKYKKSIADTCFSLSFIYFERNKMDQCQNSLNICFPYYFNRQSLYKEKLSKLHLLKCWMARSSGKIKELVDECESTWAYLNSSNLAKVKVLEFYNDIIRMYLEIISKSWSRNKKIQMNQLTSKFNQFISDNTNIPDSVRKLATSSTPSASTTDKDNKSKENRILDSRSQLANGTKGGDNPLHQKQNSQLFYRQYLSASNFMENNTPLPTFTKKGELINQKQLSEEAQLSQLREQKIDYLVNSITFSNQEVWRYIEKQFLILFELSTTKIQSHYRETIEGETKNRLQEMQLESSFLRYFVTIEQGNANIKCTSNQEGRNRKEKNCFNLLLCIIDISQHKHINWEYLKGKLVKDL